MKYLLPLFLFLAGCSHKVYVMDHPIEPEKLKKLEQNPAPILTVDPFKVSVVMAIIAILILVTWWFVKKSQNNEASVE